MPHRQMKIKTTAPLDKIVSHLEALIRSLKTGNMTLSNRQEAITLYPGEVVGFTLEADATLESRILRETIALRLKWKRRIKTASEDKPVITGPAKEIYPCISIIPLHIPIMEGQVDADGAEPAVSQIDAGQQTTMPAEPMQEKGKMAARSGGRRRTAETAGGKKPRRSDKTAALPDTGRKKRLRSP